MEGMTAKVFILRNAGPLGSGVVAFLECAC